MAIFDEKMAVGKSENLVTLHPHDLTQPSGQEIWGGRLNLVRLSYTQYPIIRNGLIRNASEVWGNFKKRLVNGSNLRNALKQLKNGH